MSRYGTLLLVSLLLGGLAAQASDNTGRLGLGLEGGLMKMVGGDLDYSNLDQHVGIRLQRGLSPHWSVELSLKYGWIRPGVSELDDEAGLSFDSKEAFYTVIWQPRVGLLYHIAPGGSVSPFLGLSLGGTSWRVKDLRGEDDVGYDPNGPVLFGFDEDADRQKLQKTEVTATVAAGLDLFFSSGWALNFGARYHSFIVNDLDNVGLSHLYGPDYVDANTGLVEGFAGMTFYFGGTDRDRDGIANRKDDCPEIPEDFDGFQDEDGCPETDNDQDGIPDAQDACPDQPEDMDGYQDADGCPDVDNDQDGIDDTSDQCPGEAEDLDGFQDEDGCPDPDNDGDGVLDANDRCPGTATGVDVDEHGCPLVAEIQQALILKGVTFETASAVLRAESQTVLDEVVQSLLAYPAVTIEIRGHTDAVGSAEANRELSLSRAEAVTTYLIEHGIDPARITSVGYGEDYPIAPNDSAEGRAQNRRVELHRTDR